MKRDLFSKAFGELPKSNYEDKFSKEKAKEIFYDARETYSLEDVYKELSYMGLEPMYNTTGIISLPPQSLRSNARRKNMYYYSRDGKFTIHDGDQKVSFDLVHLLSLEYNEPAFDLALKRQGKEKTISIEGRGFIGSEFKPMKPIELPLAETYLGNDYDKELVDWWIKDDIPLDIQRKFGLKYKHNFSIMIPYYDKKGRAVGYSERFRWRHGDEKYKTMPEFKRGHYIYGLKELELKKTLVIYEAEKSVMKSHAFGIPNCIALCGSSFNREKLYMLLELKKQGVKTIILGLDYDKAGIEGTRFMMSILSKYFDVVAMDMSGLEYKESPADRGKSFVINAINNGTVLKKGSIYRYYNAKDKKMYQDEFNRYTVRRDKLGFL